VPLSVTTEAIADPGPLVSLLQPQHPLLFMRNGDGFAGFGEAARLEFTGPTRMTDAAAAWKSLVAAATITDPLSRPGTGLVAFGSFAFADDSAATSVLIVPEVLVGRAGGTAWITRVAATGSEFAGAVPRAAERGEEFRTTFGPGALPGPGFEEAVAAAVARIRSGHLRKVVIARDIVGHVPAAADLRRPLGALARSYPDTFTFAIDGLLGSSPETLVRVQGGAVSARVLAGSIARGADAEADRAAAAELTSSPKDLDEHDFALTSVVSGIAPHSSSLESSQAPFALRLPNLWHLASDVSGTLSDGSTSLDLAAALHPTAAVAGTPTDAAIAAIAELEPFDRGRYAGPVGWVGANGDGEWAVALRCAHLDGSGTVTAYAGAGIVEGSEPARELAETTLKFRPIVEAFG
jgi:menaquinone-specific isochorismate synthase